MGASLRQSRRSPGSRVARLVRSAGDRERACVRSQFGAPPKNPWAISACRQLGLLWTNVCNLHSRVGAQPGSPPSHRSNANRYRRGSYLGQNHPWLLNVAMTSEKATDEIRKVVEDLGIEISDGDGALFAIGRLDAVASALVRYYSLHKE